MTKSRSLLISVVLGLFVMVACLCGFAGCASAKVTGIVIDGGYTSAVKVGTTLDTSSLVVKVKKSDNTETVLSADDYEITATPDTSTIGKQKIEAKYESDGTSYFASADVWVYGDLKKVTIEPNSYQKSVRKNQPYVTDSIVVIASYECDPTEDYQKTLSNQYVTFGTIDTSVAGTKMLEVTYLENGVAFSDSVEVVVNDDYTIFGFAAPINISEGYAKNSQLKNTYTVSGSTGVKGFEVTGEKYKVGSYNKFWYKPTLKVVQKGSTSQQILEEFAMAINVFEWKNGEYVALSGNELNNTVTIDKDLHWFQFNTKANGKQFKIECYPGGDLTPAEQKNVQTLTFEFVVVDGFNVYNAADLSAIDNENMQGKWTDLKNAWMESGAANGDLFNVNTNTFILHNDIKITDDMIPALHFWTAEEVAGAADAEYAVGSLKDSASIDSKPYAFVYKRYVKASANGGDTFKLEGNYFKISAQDLKLIVREGDDVRADPNGAITTHTSLFCIMANSPLNVSAVDAKVDDGTYSSFTEAEKAVSAKVEFNNTAFIGNSGKGDDALVSGGILMTKLDKIISKFNNCLAQRWFISFFTQRDDYTMSKDQFLAMTINKTNAFDAYNTMIYNWGGSVAIKDSHFIGAGGPIMINDHVDETNSNGGSSADVIVDQNSIMESYVVGSEGWFATYGAAKTLLGSIKAQNGVFQAGISSGTDTIKKTFCDSNEKLNLIGAFKAGSSQDATSTSINAKYTKEGASVNLELKKGDTYKGIVELAVISGMLSNSDIKEAVEQYMTGKSIGRYDALKEMIAFANTPEEQVPDEMKTAWTQMQQIKNVYGNNLAEQLAACESSDENVYKQSVKYAVSVGIVYVGTNGLVCMPDGNDWVTGLEPNADLFKEAQGTLYAYVYGVLGVVMTISDYENPRV